MGPHRARFRALILLAVIACTGCGARDRQQHLTFSGSALGAEGSVVRRQLARFAANHPGWDVTLRVTPDAADQRHQLYVQWLNARTAEPDVLQLDVIWTAEFAGAGWILPLNAFNPDISDFVPATVASSRWRGAVYAMPWFVDVGLLYWRTDLFQAPPQSVTELAEAARRAQQSGATRFGLVWQGARYEGLLTVFLEHLGAFGGGILDEDGRVIVDQPAAVRALTYMCDAIRTSRFVPASVLGWQEEQTRFAFENGDAAFMRNWPYAWTLLQDRSQSKVAGRFSVAPFPGAVGGHPTAALGGAELAISAWSRNRAMAWALVNFLTAPEQMLERARLVAQLPARLSLYDNPELASAIPLPIDRVRQLLEVATPRPVTPVYTELSEILQVHVHRALSGQQTPQAALGDAAQEIRTLLARSGLDATHATGAGS